jgi:hypothetical protein
LALIRFLVVESSECPALRAALTARTRMADSACLVAELHVTAELDRVRADLAARDQLMRSIGHEPKPACA